MRWLYGVRGIHREGPFRPKGRKNISFSAAQRRIGRVWLEVTWSLSDAEGEFLLRLFSPRGHFLRDVTLCEGSS